MRLKIAPSILSANKSTLQEEIDSIEPDSDYIHVDVMDGKFVPPTTAPKIKTIKSELPKDVHLMVMHPIKEGFIDAYADAGASIITIHVECGDDISKAFKLIRSKGIKVGVAINPATPLDVLVPYFNDVDMVLVMSVDPGYAGQEFIPGVLAKIEKLRRLKPDLDIEIDGGINNETVKQAIKAGANVIVAGSYIFGQKDRKEAIKNLRLS